MSENRKFLVLRPVEVELDEIKKGDLFSVKDDIFAGNIYRAVNDYIDEPHKPEGGFIRCEQIEITKHSKYQEAGDLTKKD